MDRAVYDKLEKHLCGVLTEFARNGINSPQDVMTVKNALSGINKIKSRESMECIGEVNRGMACEEETKAEHTDAMTKDEAVSHIESIFKDALKEVLTKM